MKNKVSKSKNPIFSAQDLNKMNIEAPVYHAEHDTNSSQETNRLDCSEAQVKATQIPSWAHPVHRYRYKKQLIKQMLDEYSKPIELTIDNKKQYFQVNENDLIQYEKVLNSLSLRQLLVTNVTLCAKQQLTLIERIRRTFKRKFCVMVSIIYKNKVINDYLITSNSRFIQVDNKKYIIPSERGSLNTKYKMYHYFYYENNPFPIVFSDDFDPATTPDAELLKNTINFEFAQRMAQLSEINKKIDITFIMTILNFIMLIAVVVLLVMIAKKLAVF